jgi:hypothetical protein
MQANGERRLVNLWNAAIIWDFAMYIARGMELALSLSAMTKL